MHNIENQNKLKVDFHSGINKIVDLTYESSTAIEYYDPIQASSLFYDYSFYEVPYLINNIANPFVKEEGYYNNEKYFQSPHILYILDGYYALVCTYTNNSFSMSYEGSPNGIGEFQSSYDDLSIYDN